MTIIEQTQIAFDYTALDAETRIVVQQRTSEIKDRLRRTAQDIVQIGHDLIEVKERLPHGQFGPWLSAEFDLTEGHARKLMQVARAFGQNDHYDRFAPTALYLLASPATPDEARAEALERAEAGERIEAKDAQAIIKTHKPAAPAGGKKPARPAPDVEAEEEEDPNTDDEDDDTPLTPLEEAVAATYTPPAPLTPIEIAPPTEEIAVASVVPMAPPPLLVPLTPADPAPLRRTEALVALLLQALRMAEVERDRLRRALPTVRYTLPDRAVEEAARTFLSSPAVRGSATFLAMSATEVA